MTEHKCVLCTKPINKNPESYRGRMSADLIAAIRKDHPAFHPKKDICKECGEAYAARVKPSWTPAWMSRPLG
jgi:hypothetical protein